MVKVQWFGSQITEKNLRFKKHAPLDQGRSALDLKVEPSAVETHGRASLNATESLNQETYRIETHGRASLQSSIVHDLQVFSIFNKTIFVFHKKNQYIYPRSN